MSGVAGTSPATISVFRVRFMDYMYANYDGALAAKTGVGIDELFVFSVAQDTSSEADGEALAVDASTGAVTLLGNWPTAIDLQAAAVCPAATRRRLPDQPPRTPTCSRTRATSTSERRRSCSLVSGDGRRAAGRRARARAVCVEGNRGDVYYHRDYLTPVSSNPTVFSEVQKGPAAGDWVDNAGDNLAGTFTLPEGTTDEYDFVVTIVGTPAAPVSSNANQGVLIGSLGFTVKAGLPTDATGHLTADGEVVCTTTRRAR